MAELLVARKAEHVRVVVAVMFPLHALQLPPGRVVIGDRLDGGVSASRVQRVALLDRFEACAVSLDDVDLLLSGEFEGKFTERQPGGTNHRWIGRLEVLGAVAVASDACARGRQPGSSVVYSRHTADDPALGRRLSNKRLNGFV